MRSKQELHEVLPRMPAPPGVEIGPPGSAPKTSSATPPPSPSEAVTLPGGDISPKGPTAGVSFQALDDNNTRIPPDTNGAAGPNHLMTMLNSQVRIQDKAGNNTSTVSLSSFWTSGTGLSGSPFDPKLLYDSINGRWITTCDANAASATSKVFFAISATDDPTGSWTYYSFVGDVGLTTWADYPGFGYNSTWIAITNNMFPVPSGTSVGSKMWVIDKSTALAGGPLTVTVFPTSFDLAGGFKGFTLRPCETFDAAEPKLYLMDNSGATSSGTHLLRLSEITGTGPSPSWAATAGSTFAGTGFFLVATNFNGTQIGGSQMGTSSTFDTGDPRMQNAVLRNGRIWCAHAAGLPASSTPDRTVAAWYQLDPLSMPSPIVQSGILDGGAGVHHCYPSINANTNNDACIGFSRSDSSRFIEAVATGRLSTDPAGSMDVISVLKAGEDSYEKTFSGSVVRWGDYSSTVVDPSDNLTFWTLQEYAAADVGPATNDDRWGTWWGERLVPGAPTPTPSSTITSTQTNTETLTPMFTPTVTLTFTETPTDSLSPTSTVTQTPVDTETFTPTVTLTLTPAITDTPTVAETFTPTPSDSPTVTSTPDLTSSPTITETHTATPLETASNTVSPTDTPVLTATPSLTDTQTAIETPTPTPTGIVPNYDIFPLGGDGKIDALDLLELFHQGREDSGTLFDFSRFWHN